MGRRRKPRAATLALPAAGAALLGALTDLDVPSLSQDDSIDAVAGWDSVINWACAQRSQHLAKLDRCQYPAPDQDDDQDDDPDFRTDPGVDPALEPDLGLDPGDSAVRTARWVADQDGPNWIAEALSVQTRTSTYEAHQRLATATALTGRLLATADALAAGNLTWAHATAMTRATSALNPTQAMHVEATVLADPRIITAGDLARAAQTAVLALTGPDPHTTPEPELTAGRDSTGPTLTGRLDETGAHIVATALDGAATRTDPTDQRSAARRRADALVEICTHWNQCRDTTTPCTCHAPGHIPDAQVPDAPAARGTDSAGSGDTPATATAAQRAASQTAARAAEADEAHQTDPTSQTPGCRCGCAPSTTGSSTAGSSTAGSSSAGGSSGRRPDVLITLSLDTLLGLSNAPGTLPAGQPVPADTARRLACDANLTRLILNPLTGGVIDLGRSSRSPTTAQRRRLEERDNGCRFPTCRRTRWRCQAHHIRWWTDGGQTNENNQILLCHRHHQLVHEAHWHVQLHPNNTVTWTTRTGRTYHHPAPRNTHGPDWNWNDPNTSDGYTDPNDPNTSDTLTHAWQPPDNTPPPRETQPTTNTPPPPPPNDDPPF